MDKRLRLLIIASLKNIVVKNQKYELAFSIREMEKKIINNDEVSEEDFNKLVESVKTINTNPL